MIKRLHRFHSRASIQRLYKNSKLVRCASLSMRYAPNTRREQYRLAVVVSRKVHKSAVVRNRIRRRIYENVRIMFGSRSIPYDLLITVHTDSVAGLPASELAHEVEKLFIKAKLLPIPA